ncbi:MAG: cobalt ABC transporter permease [Donghicola eburneus]|nr:cobalt ABC transporter permease [Donghicola eburneus]MCI5041471.1 cobalt ABC transporter permease [Donghicola eburneus]
MRGLALIFALLAMPLPAAAHKVIFAVFKSGDVVEGELGFSNGDMSSGAVIEAFDSAGNKIGEAITDADGFFVYAPTQAITHIFKADMGAGHVAEAEMTADDIADILGVAAAEETVAKSITAASPTTTGGVTVASLSSEERLAIAEAVRDEMRPLRRELAAYREKNDLQTILGGLGYIFGLFGLYFYIAARRRMEG